MAGRYLEGAACYLEAGPKRGLLVGRVAGRNLEMALAEMAWGLRQEVVGTHSNEQVLPLSIQAWFLCPNHARGRGILNGRSLLDGEIQQGFIRTQPS